MNRLRDLLLTVALVLSAFVASSVANHFFDTDVLVSMLFILAVFLVALFTQGYIYSIAASLVSMLAVNFAFTFPYFKFNFSIPENLISGICMLTVTIVTSTLTSKIKLQKETEIESEKEKMRANLLRAISHDLRTPLTSIHGACSVVMENYAALGEEQNLKLIGEMREDSEWLIRMVENLLSVTKISTDGDIRVKKTPTVLEELCDGAIMKFKKRYPECNINVEIPDEFIRVGTDPMLIEQVIINILENAAQHAEGMTKIDFRVKDDKGHVTFEISDDGCGIPKDMLAHIFSGEQYKRSGSADNKKHNVGIGLSVCSTIIKAHGGEIFAENMADKGALFRFTLPKEDSDEQ